MTMVTDPQMANVIVINTCGFIESAKQEAIDKILQMSEFKAPKGKCDYIIVTGCLSQRYPDDIRKFLPEVDEVLGTSHYQDIAKAIRKLYGENNGPTEAYVSEPGSLVHMRSNPSNFNDRICVAKNCRRLFKPMRILCNTYDTRRIYFQTHRRRYYGSAINVFMRLFRNHFNCTRYNALWTRFVRTTDATDTFA